MGVLQRRRSWMSRQKSKSRQYDHWSMVRIFIEPLYQVPRRSSEPGGGGGVCPAGSGPGA